jgi:formylglycine-generating enzyme
MPPNPYLNLPYADLVFIPGGKFRMGSEDGEKYANKNEKPAHDNQLPDFWLGQYPVTQQIWQEIMGENPAYFSGLHRPIESVSWYDAIVFCNKLSELCNLPPYYHADEAMKKPFGKQSDQQWQAPDEDTQWKGIPVYSQWGQTGFRLPSETEWEYAARGGQLRKENSQKKGHHYAGGDILDQVAWFYENSYGETHPVGQKNANELKLYDLSGNVREWCEDQWRDQYVKEKPRDGSPWLGLKWDARRVLRGGGWFDSAQFCRPASRHGYHPAYRYSGIGFRVALSSPPPV